MPVNLERLNTKLAALQAKDLPAIVAAQITIPFLSTPYTLNQLQSWLNKRVNQLDTAKTYTDAQLTTAMNNLYNAMNTATKQVADKIAAGENVEIPANTSNANYDRLIGWILLRWVSE